MDKETFINNYVTTFLATWTANEYPMACMTGTHKKLHEPPVEDAYFLAEKAYEHIQKIKG